MNFNNQNNAFENFIQDEISSCLTDENIGGVIDIHYCFMPWVNTFRTPSVLETNAYAGKIHEDITCLPNRYFSKIPALVDSSHINSKYEGPGKVSFKSELEFMLVGNRDEFIGLARKMTNRPFIFVVRDANNKQFVVGTTTSPAYVTSFEIKSEKKFDDEVVAMFRFEANSIYFQYDGKITVKENIAVLGDYSFEYDEDYS